MALTVGTRLGSYDIAAPLGVGGMGEVYRARDTKLGRDVALKVLPDAFAQDSERVARFQREAQLLASLNHPNIGSIHGLEEIGGIRALVLELVEGETLADRIRRGALPVDEAVAIARQIIEALEAAHERGVIHRDLKPANVKIAPDGRVKVLDFGLAKAMERAGSDDVAARAATHSPTLSLAGTLAGVILGTAAYMSPEQAKGLPADQRSDVFSFGCVVYELLTGRQAFHADSATEMLAAVLMREADLSALPADIQPRLREVVRRCLEKDPKRRWQAVGDLRLELETIAAEPRAIAATPAAAILSRRPLWQRIAPIAATAILAAAATSVLWNLKATPHAPVVRFSLVLPENQPVSRIYDGQIALSPDGTRLVYVANRQLYMRQLSDLDARPIPGTNVDASNPVFSPDGQWVLFSSYQDGTLKKIAITGGAPLTLCKADPPFGLSWDGTQILFAEPGQGIMRVSENGGAPELLASVPSPAITHGPHMLDPTHFLFTLATDTTPDRWDKAQIVVQTLGSNERKVVVQGGSDARYVSTGHVVYALGGTMLAVPFDVKTLSVTGGPVPVVEGVTRASAGRMRSGLAQYALSAAGTLAYVPGSLLAAVGPRTVAFADRDGRITPLDLPPQPYIYPRVSPDGHQIAVATDDGKEANIWVYDVIAGGSLRQLTFGGRNQFPIWTRDGRDITFQSDREGDRGIFRQRADGSGPAERLTKPDAEGVGHEPESWSPDGKALSMNMSRPGNQGIWIVSTDGDRTPKPMIDAPVLVEKHSVFSPDGRWIAYMTNTGAGNTNPEVFVQPFPLTAAKYRVSPDGGRTPLWSPDGKQIFYHQETTNRLMVIDVRTQPSFSFGKPFPLPIDRTVHPIAQRNYDITPDGKRLLVVFPAGGAEAVKAAPQVNVVLNWFDELKARAPIK